MRVHCDALMDAMGCCRDMHLLGVISISDPVDPSVPDAINQATFLLVVHIHLCLQIVHLCAVTDGQHFDLCGNW